MRRLQNITLNFLVPLIYSRSTMSKSNDIYMGGKYGAKKSGSSESGSSYDSSLSDDHKRNQSKNRGFKPRIGIDTPITYNLNEIT